MPNVMLAGVGYTNLRDLSVGPVLVQKLRAMDWPPGVEVDDWSFGPIMVVHRLQDSPGRYDRIVLFSAIARGREPGSISCYRWNGEIPGDDVVQGCMGEAVTGIISLDNLLIIAERFGVLPRDVVVVEVEPEDTNWGPGFSHRIERALDQLNETLRQVTLHGYA